MIKPILIPTDKDSTLWLTWDGKLGSCSKPTNLEGAQHIILIDTEAEIVEGDWIWCGHEVDNGYMITQYIGDWNCSESFKIISSTNKSHNLPQLSPQSVQLLIKYYNEHGAMPESVEVEISIGENNGRGSRLHPEYNIYMDITIPEVEEKLYTEEETRELCKEAWKYGKIESTPDQCLMETKREFNEWFNTKKR